MSSWKMGRRPNRLFRSSSILSRILFLHVVAVAIVCFLIPGDESVTSPFASTTGKVQDESPDAGEKM